MLLSIINFTSVPIQSYHSASRPTNQEPEFVTAERLGVMQQPQVMGDRCISGKGMMDTRQISFVYVLLGAGGIGLGVRPYA
jgi:hypothetical protein